MRTKCVRIIMTDNYQSKYLKKEGNPKKKPFLLVIAFILLAVAVLGMVLYFLGGREPESIENEPPVSITEKTNSVDAPVEMAYDVLKLDAWDTDPIQHRALMENGVAAEVFYMPFADGERELFRICLGDAAMGDHIGNVKVDEQTVPVSLHISSYSKEEFPDEETLSSYYAMMEQTNVVMDLLRSNSSFTEFAAEPAEEGSKQQAVLTYWTVELPETIAWEESGDGQTYRVDFYGTIAGERIHLYTISLGEEAHGSALGMYETGGMKLTVSVQSYSLQSQSAWPGEEYSMEHASLMESVNDVIQVITADENYSK